MTEYLFSRRPHCHHSQAGELFSANAIVTLLKSSPFRAADEADRVEGDGKRLIVLKGETSFEPAGAVKSRPG